MGIVTDRRTVIAGLAATGLASRIGPAAAQDLVAAAKREGKGTIYTVADPALIQGLLDAFDKAYGIKVQMQRLSSGPLAQRFAAEHQAGTHVADVMITTDPVFTQTAKDRGWLASVEGLPNLRDWPAYAWDGTTAIAAHVPYSIAWNTTVVTRPLTGWRDLVDPQWAGRILLPDPRVAVNAMTWYSLMRKTYGDEFLRTIGKAATYVPSAVPGAQQLAAGAAAIYAPAVHQILVGLVAKGAPIGQAFIEPTLSTDNLVSVNARAPNPAVARLLLDFALSVPGQAILNADGFSPRTGVPGTRPLPTLSEADPQATRAETPQMLALLGLA